jgi:hypothetical protein
VLLLLLVSSLLVLVWCCVNLGGNATKQLKQPQQ